MACIPPATFPSCSERFFTKYTPKDYRVILYFLRNGHCQSKIQIPSLRKTATNSPGLQHHRERSGFTDSDSYVNPRCRTTFDGSFARTLDFFHDASWSRAQFIRGPERQYGFRSRSSIPYWWMRPWLSVPLGNARVPTVRIGANSFHRTHSSNL